MGSFKDKHVVSSFSSAVCFLLTILNSGILYFYGFPRFREADHSHLNDQSTAIKASLIQKSTQRIDTGVNKHLSGPAATPDTIFPSDYVDDCSEGSIWCCSQLQINKKSYFGFPDIDDKRKWLDSCRIAASGQQVLLPKILLEHTSPYDFIDGDISFVNLQKQIDEFLDPNEGFISRMNTTGERGRGAVPISYGQFYEKAGSTQPEHMNRVPILMSAFLQYSGVRKDYLRGQDRGYKGLSLTQILHHWEKQEAAIRPEERFILVSILNENWGFLSSTFPNRTASWGKVDTKKFPTLLKFLDDPRLVMLVVNQHSNISHPKIITLPRGLPDAGGFTHHAGRMMHDTMRLIMDQNIKKSKLLFSVSSAFGMRADIVNCVKKNVPENLFDTSGASGVSLLSRKLYLLRAAASRFALAPPGLGYDTFRLWEMLNLGTIPIIEKSVGFDRTTYRLPVLLVEDFALITTEMLRDAYIEAVYQSDHFEYHRLTQTYWSNLIYQVSVTGNIDILLKNHPMEAEDATLRRPLVNYVCSNLNIDKKQPPVERGCGEGTMRPPSKSCHL